ncbi:MAG: type IV pilus assembly protein PilM [bacterium]|nr:type IV pilus assembly protein PilM [bacterium]
MFKKSLSYIGVDIGTTGIKVVELQRVAGKPRLINYGYSEEINDFAGRKLQLDIPKAGFLVKKICEDSKISSKNAVAAMPSFAVFSSVINVSNVSEKDMDTSVMWEAKKVIPLDLDEMIIDWKIISKPKEKEKESSGDKSGEDEKEADKKNSVKVLLTGAPKILVNKYVEIFKAAQLNLLSLETEMFSLVRSLIGIDPSVIAIIDWGAINTDITIIENSLPMFSRSLDIGGIMVTKAIADSLQVDYKRAEQFKLDLNNASQSDKEELPKIIIDNISPIINEIKYSFTLFQQENNKKIEKVILSGGGANLVGLATYLSEFLNINVVLSDPWTKVEYPLDLKSVLEDIGPKMAIAVGLALREVS